LLYSVLECKNSVIVQIVSKLLFVDHMLCEAIRERIYQYLLISVISWLTLSIIMKLMSHMVITLWICFFILLCN